MCNAGDSGSIPGLGRFPWRRERPPTPVFLPGEFHELYGPWGHKESDTTEQLPLHFLCIRRADLLYCPAETSTTFSSNYTPIKKIKIVLTKKIDNTDDFYDFG